MHGQTGKAIESGSYWGMLALYIAVAASPITGFLVNLLLLIVTIAVAAVGPEIIRAPARRLSWLNAYMLAFVIAAVAIIGVGATDILLSPAAETGVGSVLVVGVLTLAAIAGMIICWVKAIIEGMNFADSYSTSN